MAAIKTLIRLVSSPARVSILGGKKRNPLHCLSRKLLFIAGVGGLVDAGYPAGTGVLAGPHPLPELPRRV
jgi:hypothetical protein